MQPKRLIEKNYYTDGDLNILYLSIPSGSLNIQTSLNMDVDSIDKLLTKLPKVMLFFAIPLLIISFLTAKFLSSRMLRPVADITRTANEISASQLDKRIPEPDSKDELQELAKTFNRLFARLQQDFERERRFTSDVSHELRTPLAVLLGHLDLLRRWGKTDTNVLDNSLETLYSETKSMQSLVENLLLLSRRLGFVVSMPTAICSGISKPAPFFTASKIYVSPLSLRNCQTSPFVLNGRSSARLVASIRKGRIVLRPMYSVMSSFV
ncbi:MAG: HAMP domain-containing protein [Spirochaetaceae bacterium]|nr:HAMP domain-containing protein [Spirochaetaceae bacterium]